MAKSNFNFNAVLKLQTKDFKQGVKDIQRSLNGLKTSFMNFAGALGLSLGLGKFVSMLKDTSIQLDTAKNVLENVSKSTAEYNENMNFLQKISKAYNQDLIVLINTFGQFRAAADTSGLSVEQLRDIFGSLTRAAGAFHMSADRTRDMMNAVQQMFSKGKVSAEELRRQLGNALPGAFNLMAKAAGMAGITANGTTAELEDMMRKGQVLAKDVMPAFAAVLDQVTANANFDSLQGSLNRLKNEWTNFVDKSNFKGFFKGLVDAGSWALGKLSSDFSTFKAYLFGSAAGILGAGLWKTGKKRITEFSNATATEIDRNARKLDILKKKLEETSKQLGTTAIQMPKGVRNVKNVRFNEKGAYGIVSQLPENAKKQIIEYNEALIKQNKIMKSLGFETTMTSKEIKRLETYTKRLAATTESLGTSTIKQISGIRKVWAWLGNTVKAVGASIKAAFGGIVVGAILGAITAIFTKLHETGKEANRIKNIVSDTVNEVNENSSAQGEVIAKLRTAKGLLQNTEKGSKVWNDALNTVNTTMGKIGDEAFTAESNINDIVGACDEWIKKLKEVSRLTAITNKMTELEGKNLDLELANNNIREHLLTNKDAHGGKLGRLESRKYQKELEKNTKEIEQNKNAIKELTNIIEKEGLSNYPDVEPDNNNNNNNNNGGDGGGKGPKFDDDAEIDKYDKDMHDLGGRLLDKMQQGIIKGMEDKLNKEANENINKQYANAIYNNLHGPQERDTSFDYKKSDADITKENLEIWEDYLEKLIEARNELIKLGQQSTEQFEQLNIAIGEAAGSVTNMRDAAKLAEWKADIEELSKSYRENLYSSVRDVAGSFERLYNIYKDFAEVFGAEIDPEGNFQKILTVFGALFETFETVYSVIESIQKLQEVGAALEEARNNKKMLALEEQIGLTAALGAAEVSAAETATAALVGQTAAQKALAGAQLTAAGAAAAKNAMELPYPYNLAALAENIAAVMGGVASVKALQAFANGGIVGGNTKTGDKQLIRANSGEMVLTKSQQGTLFNMLNGKAGLGGGQVEFKIHGSDLVGTLKNYGQKIRG